MLISFPELHLLCVLSEMGARETGTQENSEHRRNRKQCCQGNFLLVSKDPLQKKKKILKTLVILFFFNALFLSINLSFLCQKVEDNLSKRRVGFLVSLQPARTAASCCAHKECAFFCAPGGAASL